MANSGAAKDLTPTLNPSSAFETKIDKIRASISSGEQIITSKMSALNEK